ncbi:hypothetical protein OIU85_004574 [Salix viminalis]|uniref:KIB1-4 beta-propeller domain-containing protein n=1 Tax=Salix viminalis TaxID=40686 RepID=A0A9Q0PST3_SALVM|nr:hypothetical protein OIU85_004574 [Salix viminalis]
MEANTKEEGEEGESLQCWPPTVGLHPWLVFINGSSEENQTFYDTQKVIDMSKAFQSCKNIQLPSLTPDFSYDNCVLSSPPDNPECVVMFLNFDIGTFDVTFCKPDNVEWIRQDFKLHDEDDSDYVRSVGVHKGDICILTWYEHLYFVKFDKSYSITLVDLKVDDNTCPTMSKLHSRFPTYLVETCDFDKKVWTTIKELKDQAFFIGSSGGQVLACSTEESRIHGNKIYLTLAEERSLHVYDLDLCALEVCLPCPNVKADWVQNVWILPVFED